MLTITNIIPTYTNPYHPIPAALKLPKSLWWVGGVVGGGGLFDYSVYSWSRFNQEPSRFDQEGTMTTSPPGQDKDQDQELDNNTN